ncbi:hypothetical protein N7474_003050 [Penicillium riverlandense]|uniref:uncharacterized protein n=1 Tax=Penicillium riverlandense TaxID=1903569 RepID=UPI0025471E59|nr:uncharacterized protein N7474_003050 [Penicillium riverlandense]KAJ5825912.1 hypothetical protein N7474_003050 [Penicillium riverlandense]
MMFLSVLLSLPFVHNAVAQRNDADMMSFMTLPDVRAMKFETEIKDRERLTEGYWFVAPYGQIDPEHPTKRYEQYQIGPYIYDNDGILIWAGSPMTDNLNVFDFKAVWHMDGDPRLSFIWQRDFEGSTPGSGMVLNHHYEIENEVGVTNNLAAFNMHEFNILPGGKTAVACTYRSQEKDLSDFDRPNEKTWLQTGGFVEIDIATSEVLHEWDSLDRVNLHESNMYHAWDAPAGKPGSDYVHINAVDKNNAGNYIISMRYTNTLYYIDGKDGHIIWRLGGADSDFEINFTFSFQHDVKFVSSNGTHHVISFMNNASTERGNDEDHSCAFVVEIDETDMSAKVIRRINRPDGGLTRLRGNVQLLPNDNVFIGWSERGYHTEHAPNGDLLLTARFASTRYSTYRAYKFPFIGRPLTPPDVVSSVYGTNDEDLTTIVYASWNGATDVAGWNFYAQAYDRGDKVLIGYADKVDFETMYIVDGFMDWISAEAVDFNGTVMGTSKMHRTETPDHWKSSGWQGHSDHPAPDDPELIKANVGNSPAADTDGMDGMDGMSDGAKSGSTYADAKQVTKAVYKAYEVIKGVGGFLIFILVVCSVGGALYGAWRMVRYRRHRAYHHIPNDEGLPMDEARAVNDARSFSLDEARSLDNGARSPRPE